MNIPDGDLMKMLGQIGLQIFEPDQILFKTSEYGEFFFIVLKGRIDLFLPNSLKKKLGLEIAVIERLIHKMN
jgi:CRP-like cAMP-binding protein